MISYKLPTHKTAKMIGDSLLAVGTFITGGGMLAFDQMKDAFGEHDLKLIMGISFVAGALGKFVTNFFKDTDGSSYTGIKDAPTQAPGKPDEAAK